MTVRLPKDCLLLLTGFFIGAALALINLTGTSASEPVPEFIATSAQPTHKEGQEAPYKPRKKPAKASVKPRQSKAPVRFYWTTARQLSAKEIECLALNIYHEARGESWAGKVGVAQITINRADTAFRKKKTICSVVYDPAQFSWTLSTKKRFTRPQGDVWGESLLAAKEAASGLRIKGLETSKHYYAEWIRPPYWSKGMTFVLPIGQHRYLADNS